MPNFSRAQLGVLLLVAALFLGLYAGRGRFGWLSWHTAAASPAAWVEVQGDVARPGVYPFSTPPTLAEAWRLGGGPEPAPVTAAPLPPQACIEVGRGGEYTLGPMSGERLLTLGLPLDLNTATAGDLEALPGVGPVLARRIVQYRESQGPYKKIADLLAVHGLGKKKLAHLQTLIMVSAHER